MSMIYPIANSLPVSNSALTSSLLVCRGCLATDARLYDMRQHNLLQAYCTLLNTNILATSDLPHYLCNYCTALLHKYDAFRTKCIETMSFFKNPQLHNIDLTLEQIKQINRPPHFKQSYILNINIDAEKQGFTDNLPQPVKAENDYNEKPNNTNLDNIPNNEFKNENDTNLDNISNNESILRNALFNTSGEILNDIHVNQDIETVSSNPIVKEKYLESDNISDCESNNNVSDDDIKSDDDDDEANYIEEEIDIPNLDVNSNSDITPDDHLVDEKEVDLNIEPLKMEIDTEEENDSMPLSTHIASNLKKDTNIINTILNLAASGKRIRMNEDTKEKILKLNSLGVDIDVQHMNFDEDIETDCNNDIKKNLSNKFLERSDVQAILKTKQKVQTKKRALKEREAKIDKESLSKLYNIEVVELSREEQLNDIESRKETQKYKSAQFKCNLCYRGFSMEETYKNHLLLHDDVKGKQVCDICHFHYKSIRRLYKHKYTHRRKFICKECGFVMQSSYQARDHFRWHGGARFRCKQCGKEFNHSSNYFAHIKYTHVNIDQVRCEMCGHSFSGEHGLDCHEKRAHFEMFSPECLCSGCDTQFYCSDAFKAHRGTDGLCDTLHKYCVRCGMSFETEELLKEHEIEQRKAPKEFKCEECDKTFKNHHYYIAHMKKTIKHAPNRFIDMKLKNKERNGQYYSFVCEQCGKTCKTIQALKIHQDFKHSDKRPFHCTICKKTFKSLGSLKYHIVIHSDERPFECDICHKRFNSNLTKHKRLVHSKDRPFSCDICGKSFAFKSILKDHIRIVHMKVPTPPKIRRRNKKT